MSNQSPPWNTDMSAAPRFIEEIKTMTVLKDGVKTQVERVVQTPVKIDVTCSHGKVFLTRWVPETSRSEGRWEFFTAEHPPIAWMHRPDPYSPSTPKEGEAA